ncbi:hypothetical protein CTAYLR_005151 [Chrysophaeum taylorii]|uniref:Mechanosensitive ion channel MscS domain-containing protein n=1 Tax=Chrysophaeum taylorii TaxID=2483200 RepID=A0AAD7ULE5_9STRA|nr:hypothetical protein CTAYLR_005151 [Chrysophaeum taylorii]
MVPQQQQQQQQQVAAEAPEASAVASAVTASAGSPALFRSQMDAREMVVQRCEETLPEPPRHSKRRRGSKVATERRESNEFADDKKRALFDVASTGWGGLPRVLLAVFKVAVMSAIALAALMPQYQRGPGRGRPLSATQARWAAGRAGFGCVLGNAASASISSALSTDAAVRHFPILVFVGDSLGGLPLDILGSGVGCYAAPRIARLVGVPVLGGRRLYRAVRVRFRRFLVTILVLVVSWSAQRVGMRWFLRRWSAEKFSERVAQAVAARRVVRALVLIAETAREKEEKGAGERIVAAISKRWLKKPHNNGRRWHEEDTTTTTKEAPPPPPPPVADTDEDERVRSFEHGTNMLRVVFTLGAFGNIGSTADGRRAGKLVFRHLRNAAGGTLTRNALKSMLFDEGGVLAPQRSEQASQGMNMKVLSVHHVTEQDAENMATFDDFFPAAHRELREHDLVELILRVYSERSFLSATIQSFGAINDMLVRVAEGMWLVVALIFTLAFWRVPLSDFILAFGTISLALSLAIGSSGANVFSGLVFVLGSAPYDIGERVIVSNVAESPTAFPMFVERISPLTTTFRTSFGETLVVANHVLASKQIINHGRSPRPWLMCTIKLSTRTPPEEISKLAGALQIHARNNTRDWVGIDLVFSRIEHDKNVLVLDCWCGAANPYQDFTNLYAARSRLYLFIHAYIHAAGLHYVAPIRPVLSVDQKVVPDAYFGTYSGDPPPPPPPVADTTSTLASTLGIPFRTAS